MPAISVDTAQTATKDSYFQQPQGQKRIFEQSANSAAAAMGQGACVSSSSSVKSAGISPLMPKPYLSAYCVYKYPKTSFQAPERGTTIRAYVSCAESPLDFSIVYENNMEKVKKMDFMLTKFYETDPYVLPLPQEMFVVGTACVAKFEGNWYRAIIKEVDGDNITLHYIDYGNLDKKPRKEVMSLRRDRQCEIPPLCVSCRLAGIPLDYEITSEQSDKFWDAADPMERAFLVQFEPAVANYPYPIRMIDCVLNASVNVRMMEMLGILPPETPLLEENKVIENFKNFNYRNNFLSFQEQGEQGATDQAGRNQYKDNGKVLVN